MFGESRNIAQKSKVVVEVGWLKRRGGEPRGGDKVC